MKTASERLHGINLKIDRARKHIEEFEVAARFFGELNRNAFDIETDEIACTQNYRVKFRASLQDHIPLIIGDAVHNLRSSLDYLIWQLVEANGEVPTKRTCFPICEKEESFKTAKGAKLKGLSATALAMFETFQPFKSADQNLLILEELDNHDKHRLLIVAACNVADFGSFVDFGMLARAGHFSDGKVFSFKTVVQGNIDGKTIVQDGDLIASVPISGIERFQAICTNYTIAFDKPEIVHAKPVIPCLTELMQHVIDIVNQFKSML